MAGASMGDGDEAIAVNVTPLIDVIFCLCLFFMCSFHFKQLEGRLDAWLPKETGPQTTPVREPVLEEMRVLVRLDERSGHVAGPGHVGGLGHVTWTFGAREVASLDELEGLLAQGAREAAASGKKDTPVVIDSEPRVPWKAVLAVFDRCKRSGIDKVQFTQPMPPRSGS